MEQLDLVQELITFLTEQTPDRDEAIDYLSNTQPSKYGFTELVEFHQFTSKEKEEYKKSLSEQEINHTIDTIRSFRQKVTSEVNPYGDHYYGVEIHKDFNEIYS